MTVVNVPANSGVQLPQRAVPGLMHVYCVGPGPATFGITIYNPPPPYMWHQLTAGNMLTFQVDNYAAWVFNQGPSGIQLLYGAVFEGQSIEDVEGATLIMDPEAQADGGSG